VRLCTPGLLVAAKALLDRNPNPTETEARYWLAGNLCRCTGYDKVIRAVLDAAAELRATQRSDDVTMYLGRFESN
jgi:aerobic carbon-monoxide dehydrogenase small subunit